MKTWSCTGVFVYRQHSDAIRKRLDSTCSSSNPFRRNDAEDRSHYETTKDLLENSITNSRVPGFN